MFLWFLRNFCQTSWESVTMPLRRLSVTTQSTRCKILIRSPASWCTHTHSCECWGPKLWCMTRVPSNSTRGDRHITNAHHTRPTSITSEVSTACSHRTLLTQSKRSRTEQNTETNHLEIWRRECSTCGSRSVVCSDVCRWCGVRVLGKSEPFVKVTSGSFELQNWMLRCLHLLFNWKRSPRRNHQIIWAGWRHTFVN